MDSNVIEKTVSVASVEVTPQVSINSDKSSEEVPIVDGRSLYKGDKGDKGDTGKSAYEVAVADGFVGTEEAWLESLKGKAGEKGDAGYTPQKNVDYFDGKDGDSAYEIAVKNGFEGSEQEWLASLKGKDSDESITAEGIETALGYKPANKDDVPTDLSELNSDSAHRTVTDIEKNAWNEKSNFSGSYNDLSNKPTIPSKTSQLTNDSGYLTSVPSEYVTESELNAKGYLTQHQDLSSYAKKSELPTKPSDIGAEASGTADIKVSAHNTSTVAHSDIRLLIEGLTTRLNALANSDDTTLDQMAEVVAYIKANRTLIESVTTDKVNVADIINNLTTNVANKPLSAAQGVALKELIDNLQTAVNAIKVPTKTSELTNDSGFLKAVPSEYVTDSELTAKGYATQSSVNSLSEEIADLKNLLVDGNGVAY